jgi:acetoin utilization deacetylase AcuC-like enzyme
MRPAPDPSPDSPPLPLIPPTPIEGVSLFYDPSYLEHDTGRHPESADRLRAILVALRERGIDDEDLLRPQPVDIDLLSEVHDRRYIEALERGARSGGGYWDLDTYISPRSYDAAMLAAGAAVDAVDAVMSGARFAFALVRPPGHHALRQSAMGFCLLNNIGVAAHHAVRDHGLQRVMIVDWDVHHGNGTQDLFYSRPDVLFFSTHRYPFYPGTGALGETGAGPGRGFTVNVPLPAEVDDEGHKRVFEEVLVPLARRYEPQLVLISAGYDSHVADPLGGMAVSVAGFYELARIVRGLADELSGGRVAAVLEGGYNVQALALSVVATISAMGAQQPDLQSDDLQSSTDLYARRHAPDVRSIISQVKQTHNL